MATVESSASTAHPSTPLLDEEARARCARGLKLYHDKGHLIEWVWPHVYRVPSCSGSEAYTVDLTTGYCSCPDHRPRKVRAARCKHVAAAEIFSAKKKAARV